MADVAIAIEKGASWRGSEERWANVYHMQVPWTVPVDPSDADALIQKLVDFEKLVHSSSVFFRSARVWETGGTAVQNETIRIKDLTGAGTMASGVAIWLECCGVPRIDAGRNTSTGRKIYLRKYIHSCGLPSGDPGASGQTGIGATYKGLLNNYGNSIKSFTFGAGVLGAQLQAPGGQDLPVGAAVSVGDYLHVRQFKRH